MLLSGSGHVIMHQLQVAIAKKRKECSAISEERRRLEGVAVKARDNGTPGDRGLFVA